MPTKALTATDIVKLAPEDLRPILLEMFKGWSPSLRRADTPLAELFRGVSARQQLDRLTALEQLLSPEDTFDEVMAKIQHKIEETEQIKARFLGRIFEEIRPLEESYNHLWMFFENARTSAGQQRPGDLHVLNADPSVLNDAKTSNTLAALTKFISTRNDSFDFRLTICNLVMPGYIDPEIRPFLEQLCDDYGVLLISDLRDEKSVDDVVAAFSDEQDSYQYLARPQERAAAHVVLCGHVMTRRRHSFETDTDEGLYIPASMAFAGAIIRTDNTVGLGQGPVGTKFGEVRGALKCRVNPGISDTGRLARQRQVIPIIRSGDNQLCFYGCRTLAQDEYGPYKFFTAFRILRNIERMTKFQLLDVAFRSCRPEVLDDLELRLRRELEKQKEAGTIIKFKLDINRDWNQLKQGVCPIELFIQPTGPLETFKLNLMVTERGAEATAS